MTFKKRDEDYDEINDLLNDIGDISQEEEKVEQKDNWPEKTKLNKKTSKS